MIKKSRLWMLVIPLIVVNTFLCGTTISQEKQASDDLETIRIKEEFIKNTYIEISKENKEVLRALEAFHKEYEFEISYRLTLNYFFREWDHAKVFEAKSLYEAKNIIKNIIMLPGDNIKNISFKINVELSNDK